MPKIPKNGFQLPFVVSKAEVPTAVAEAPSNVALVEKAFPEKRGFRRKVNLLWEGFYRVNFHDQANDNKISDSHFVCIVDGEAIERKE